MMRSRAPSWPCRYRVDGRGGMEGRVERGPDTIASRPGTNDQSDPSPPDVMKRTVEAEESTGSSPTPRSRRGSSVLGQVGLEEIADLRLGMTGDLVVGPDR